MIDVLLTTEEASHFLGVQQGTVAKYIQRGQLKATKRAGAWFIAWEDLERFRRQPPGWKKGKPRK